MAVSPLALLTGFLKALEVQLPTTPAQPHTLQYGQVGSDLNGWRDVLCLQIARAGLLPVTLVVDEDDFDKPVEQLVATVVKHVERATAAEPQARAAEFDRATGG